jgi:hypothetical protein
MHDGLDRNAKPARCVSARMLDAIEASKSKADTSVGDLSPFEPIGRNWQITVRRLWRSKCDKQTFVHEDC